MNDTGRVLRIIVTVLVACAAVYAIWLALTFDF